MGRVSGVVGRDGGGKLMFPTSNLQVLLPLETRKFSPEMRM